MLKISNVLCAAAMCLSAGAANAEDLLKKGEYLSKIMDCGGCHTEGALAGRPDPALRLAGSSIGFAMPDVGIFYPPNLTPDADTGLGRWSDADVLTAIRTGVRPDGRHLMPVMPWPAYAALTDEDGRALVMYLKSLPAVRHATPAPVGPSEKPVAPYLAPVIPK